jgi:simple sugar transport system ATP-binding protein
MRGAAVVLVSEDLDELLALSDRVAVMTRGRLLRPEPVETVTPEALGLRMAGQAEGSEAA